MPSTGTVFLPEAWENASFVATTGLQISHKALVTLRRLPPASLCSFFVQIIPFFKANENGASPFRPYFGPQDHVELSKSMGDTRRRIVYPAARCQGSAPRQRC
jgi:hypothetical protein